MLVVALFACPCLAVAQAGERQPSLADSSVVSIMARAGAHPNAPWVVDILRQRYRPQSASKLRELGDSLTARVIAARFDKDRDPRRYAEAASAMSALGLAAIETPPGTPYRGVLERLIKIHQESPVAGLRSQALSRMLAVGERGRAVKYLRSVAMSSSDDALSAVGILMTDATGGTWNGPSPSATQREESAAVLKELHDRHLVKVTAAAKLLELWSNRPPVKP